MQQDYQTFLQRQVAIAVGVATVLLAAISYFRLTIFFGRSRLTALADPVVSVVAGIGVLFLATTVRSGRAGRWVQVGVAYITACSTAIFGGGGDLTSTVFLIVAMMLASEYGLLTSRSRLLVGLPLAIYVGAFIEGTYSRTGVILASVHVFIAAVLVAYVFVAIIRTRLQQVHNREDELESLVAVRTEVLQDEVKRRAELEASLRISVSQSQTLASERALLLHELHHRTKNDLQLIASMIRLHGESEDDFTRDDLLATAEDRIMAIALVHEHLYSAEQLSAIRLSDYLDGLISYLRSAHSGSAIAIVEDIDTTMSVGIEPAIHLGLAINELVQNARKHAFPGATQGTVRVSVNEMGEYVQVKVADDGVGMKVPPSAVATGSIGIEIVHGLVSQMDGQISVESRGNTVWTIVLPRSSMEASGGSMLRDRSAADPTVVEDVD